MKKITNILFWSVISAAFIGPGTVTTAAKSGASFGYALLWALVFSTIACMVLQEASARLSIVSGKNLGDAIRDRFSEGVHGLVIRLLVVSAIVFGCAAYEAGNILGGVAGAVLGTGFSKVTLTIACGLLAGMLLWFGNTKLVAQILGFVVAVMGVAFLVTAIMLAPSIPDLLSGAFLPSAPPESGLLIMGLIGTTVVPYNLFLGSGIAQGHKLGEMRFGLSVAVILGGFISGCILIVGTSLAGEFSFEALTQALETTLGGWSRTLFAVGLFAAGFSSAITAPLAAAITAKSFFQGKNPASWEEKGAGFRGVWLGVLLVGVFFGLSGVQPIATIILAQALNGLALPIIAVFLLIVVNDVRLMEKENLNHWVSNSFMSAIVFITIVLGLSHFIRAMSRAFGFAELSQSNLFILAAVFALILSFPLMKVIRKNRSAS